MPRRVRNDPAFIRDRQQFDEGARQLYDVVLRAPGARMSVARANLEAEPAIEFCCRVEIVHSVDDVIEAPRQKLHQPALVYGGADERRKQRMRLERARFQLGMKLHADEPGMILVFDDLRQNAVGRHA